jgi:hypothetical protein
MPTRGRRWNNVGIALAIIAGLSIFGFATWPIAPPPARGDLGPVWGVGAWIVALGFVASAFLVDRHVVFAKAILAAGAAFLATSALVDALAIDRPMTSLLTTALDLFPAVLGFIAAGLIGPVQMSPEEWAARHGRLPERRDRDMDRAA